MLLCRQPAGRPAVVRPHGSRQPQPQSIGRERGGVVFDPCPRARPTHTGRKGGRRHRWRRRRPADLRPVVLTPVDAKSGQRMRQRQRRGGEEGSGREVAVGLGGTSTARRTPATRQQAASQQKGGNRAASKRPNLTLNGSFGLDSRWVSSSS